MKELERRIADTLELATELRRPSYDDELEVELYGLQAWAHRSDEGFKILQTGRRSAAAKFLKHIADKKQSTKIINTSSTLIRLFKNTNYKALFDEVFGMNGGWPSLLYNENPHDSVEAFRNREEIHSLSFQITDYQFRSLDHNQIKQANPNVSHADVFVWHQRNPKISGSTIRRYRQIDKQGSIFLYVAALVSYDFSPANINKKNFCRQIRRKCQDKEALKAYISQCAYVADTRKHLKNAPFVTGLFPPPESLARLRPKTFPLSDTELNRLSDYKKDRDKLKDN